MAFMLCLCIMQHVGIHKRHSESSGSMSQRNKTAVHQKVHDGAKRYTSGRGGVFEGCRISHYNTIRKVNDSRSLSRNCMMILL